MPTKAAPIGAPPPELLATKHAIKIAMPTMAMRVPTKQPTMMPKRTFFRNFITTFLAALSPGFVDLSTKRSLMKNQLELSCHELHMPLPLSIDSDKVAGGLEPFAI